MRFVRPDGQDPGRTASFANPPNRRSPLRVSDRGRSASGAGRYGTVIHYTTGWLAGPVNWQELKARRSKGDEAATKGRPDEPQTDN